MDEAERVSAMEPEDLVEALSDYLDQTEEAGFDPAVPSAYLKALEARAPEAPPFDPAAAEAAFRARHRDLFPQAPRPRRRFRLGRRAAALAAAAALCTALAVTTAGQDLFHTLASWSRGEFRFSTGPGVEGAEGYTDDLWGDGTWPDGQAALDALGIDEAMLPTWLPAWEGEEIPGLEVTVTQEEDGDLLVVEDHRTASGAGYTFEVRRRGSAAEAQADVVAQGAAVYRFDGRTYYLLPEGEGRYSVTWASGDCSGRIWGDVDRRTAKRFARSVTQRETIPYEVPDMSVPPEHATIQAALEVAGIDPACAPEELPQGFVPVSSDVFVSESGSFRVAHLFCTDVEGERNLSLSFTLSSDPSSVSSTVIPKDDAPVETFQQGGVTFYLIQNLDWRTLAWTDGGLCATIGGGLTEDECRQIAASIPRYAP